MKRKLVILALIIIILISCIAVIINCIYKDNGDKSSNQSSNLQITEGEDEEMQIVLNVNGNSFTATLEDNETTRELLRRLPLNITMNELNGNEKYYYFTESFPSNSYRPERINAGDIMLYGDDCLVIFYDDFKTSYSYTKIGKIDNVNNLKNVLGRGNITVSIDR